MWYPWAVLSRADLCILTSLFKAKVLNFVSPSCSARFIRSLSTRTVFDGLWFIFLYVYKFLADTTSNVVKCVKVEGNAIEEKGYFRLVCSHEGCMY